MAHRHLRRFPPLVSGAPHLTPPKTSQPTPPKQSEVGPLLDAGCNVGAPGADTGVGGLLTLSALLVLAGARRRKHFLNR